MEIKEINKLVRRIREEPSVLFLGQDYLKSYDGCDVFMEAVRSSGNSWQSDSGYSKIWENYSQNQEMGEESLRKLVDVRNTIPMQRWLRGLLSMKWGMVITSSIDGVMQHCTGENFDLDIINYDKKNFNVEYMNKKTLHASFLYGTIDGDKNLYPPRTCDAKTLRSLRKRVKDRIGWIYNHALCGYGVLIIDGWNPDTDWADFLLEDASDMPYGSIYIFGIDVQTAQQNTTISGLVEDGIVCIEEKSLAFVLKESGYFEREAELEMAMASQGNVRTVTLKDAKGRELYYDVSMFEMDALDENIVLVHDTLGENHKSYDDLKETFALFLHQSNMPAWPLYQKRLGFYFDRKVDVWLEEAVSKELKKNSYRGRLVLLEGVSNSGKTAALVNLALKLREKQRSPVFFISGNPMQKDYIERLKGIIKWYFIDEPSCHERVQDVVIIWDNNHEVNAVVQYEKLMWELMECNPIVIGSSYGSADSSEGRYTDKRGNQHIHIDASLEKEEIDCVRKVLKKVDSKLLEHFEAEVQREKSSQEERVHLLESLLKMSKFSYSQEWRNVSENLVRKYHREVTVVENKAQKAEDLYWEELKKAEETILAYGIGAAWRVKLQMALEGSRLECRQNAATEKFENEMKIEKDIRLLNDMLAMAGQFLAELPLGLLLRVIHGDGMVIPREDLFINDVLKSDSLLDYNEDAQGYVKVKFRNPKEAELYLEKNYSLEQERKNKEVELLLLIIKWCRWNEEGYDVLSLVRRFGSNSDGKYSEQIRRGHYFAYKDWWRKISEVLIENAEENTEAVLVYAHFLRDISRNEKNRELLHEAAGTLRRALEAHDQGNQMQYCRLLVEICANLVEEMEQLADERKYDKEIYQRFRGTFRQAVSKWAPASTNNYFDQNSLLDIGLNALKNYRTMLKGRSRAVMEDENFMEALAETVHYIEMLFKMESNFESADFLNKIEDIYSWYDGRSMEKISNRLEQKGNDTYLFLEASRCWIFTENKKAKLQEFVDLVRYNTFLLPDDADRYGELYEKLDELRVNAVLAAKKALEVLEPKLDSIRKMQSGRCLYMLIKAKWLVYTERLPLEEKQMPRLSMEQWQELYQLCEDCIGYTREDYPVKPAVYFIDAMYRWIYTKEVRDALSMFSNARQEMRRAGCVWFIERMGLCKTGTNELREFNVDIQRTASGNFEARLCKEISNEKVDATIGLVGRKEIHVSDKVLKYLFDGQPPRDRFNIPKKVSIWFTAQGASLGVAKEEKGGSRK